MMHSDEPDDLISFDDEDEDLLMSNSTAARSQEQQQQQQDPVDDASSLLLVLEAMSSSERTGSDDPRNGDGLHRAVVVRETLLFPTNDPGGGSRSNDHDNQGLEVHTDSVLYDSLDELEEEDDFQKVSAAAAIATAAATSSTPPTIRMEPFYERSPSLRYMEEASMETELWHQQQHPHPREGDALLLPPPPPSSSSTGQPPLSNNNNSNNNNIKSYTKIAPAGPLGRRRPSVEDANLVVPTTTSIVVPTTTSLLSSTTSTGSCFVEDDLDQKQSTTACENTTANHPKSSPLAFGILEDTTTTVAAAAALASSSCLSEESERGIFQSPSGHSDHHSDRPAASSSLQQKTQHQQLAGPEVIPNLVSSSPERLQQQQQQQHDNKYPASAPPSLRRVSYKPLTMAPELSALQVLQSYNILPDGNVLPTSDDDGSNNNSVDDEDTMALHALLDGFCTPPVSREACRKALQLARCRPDAADTSLHFALPEQPTICVSTTTTTTPTGNNNNNANNGPTSSRIVALLQDRRSFSSNNNSSSSSNISKHHAAPILLQLPVHFASALVRLLVRLLSHETDAEYHAHCFWTTCAASNNNNNNNNNNSSINVHQEPALDPDHATQRPHLPYSVARFQCTWIHALQQSGDNNSNSSSSQSINNDARLAVQTVLTLWERVVFMDSAASNSTGTEQQQQSHAILVAPLARLLGLFATAGLTPRLLRRMLSLAQSGQLPTVTARLSMVRALATAAAGAPQSPRQFFCFSLVGLERTITGLSTWPFRNDFGLCCWFRAERWDQNRHPILLSARTDDGGGVQVSIVPIESKSRSSDKNDTADACTIAISIFDSKLPGQRQHNNEGDADVPAHYLVVRGGLVLLPRVWYHLAVRHTRSRLKGVFSLSTRQQVTVMLDGKVMVTESLQFPRIGSDSDNFMDDPSSSIMSTLRRSSTAASLNLTIRFGCHLEGQTGAIHLFNDNVSDASFRALYEATGGGTRMHVRRSHSLVGGDAWDARRSDLVRRSRVLAATSHGDAADDIVFSQRGRRSSKKKLLEKTASVLDLIEGDDQEDSELPADLQKGAFGSKIFITWDPRRTSGSLALELHVGAHVHLDEVYSWRISRAQDVISTVGGVQSLVPLFRSFVNGDIERSWAAAGGVNTTECRQDVVLTAVPDLFRVMRAFIQDHNHNIRELLRCGGIDVIEQLLHNSKKLAIGRGPNESIFGALSSRHNLACLLVKSLLDVRHSCSHNALLETKIYSRLLFNIPLWVGGFSQIPGVSLHIVILPVLSHLTMLNPEKVRDCVGVSDLVNTLKECSMPKGTSDRAEEVNRFEADDDKAAQELGPLTCAERRYITNCLLGLIFTIISSGTTPHDLAPYIHFLSSKLDEYQESLGKSNTPGDDDKRRIILSCCTLFLFWLQVRPVIPGLYESFAHTCGGVQGGVSWILIAMVNSFDDSIRSLGVRCVAAYLDVTSRGADAPLSLGSLMQPAPSDHGSAAADMSSTVRRAATIRFSRLAQGLASMGPRAVVLAPSKLTARVVFKLLWHLLKSHRSRLGADTRIALLDWITNSEGHTASSLASLESIKSHMIVHQGRNGQVLYFDAKWVESAFADTGNFVGKPLRNPLAIGTVLRLLRFLENEAKDRWLNDLLSLTKSNRKCINTLASLSEWQTCLFPLISETLELVSSHPMTACTDDRKKIDIFDTKEYTMSLEGLHKRLDLCLHLYSSLLGHLLRTGGDGALDAVENVAALQRVFVNGQHVLLLIMSSLCGNIFEQGTLLDVGSLTAQDWKEMNIDEDSLLLKQSARLITDAILSNGTKGLDLTTAVRSWRSLRHLTEVLVAIVTRSGFGVVDLFDYVNHQASSIDNVSKGLHGIRLLDSYSEGVKSAEYVSFLQARIRPDGDNERGMDRRLCARLAAQILTLLDAFIFPQALDASLPAAQLDGFALVRFSEARLGSSQGPLISSAIRLSFLLLNLLEPCSVIFLQCASRLRCLLCWALELLREASISEGNALAFHRDGVAHIDRLLLAIVLHCHRALGRCASLLSEIESASFVTYFRNEEVQKKYCRRLLRVALELRDVVSTAYRGRNELLRSSLSTDAHEALRDSLEGAFTPGRNPSKESVVRDFLTSKWVAGFQDTVNRRDLAVPEQVSMDAIPLSSDEETNPGFSSVVKLSEESINIVSDFEKSIDSCFEVYLEVQRKWAETEAVRDLEYDGDTTLKKMTEKCKADGGETAKLFQIRRNGAESRWRTIQRNVSEPWKSEAHWKLARYTDPLGRRTLLVQNRQFIDHSDASYDLIMGKEREKEEADRQKRLREKQELSDVMRRNAAAFIGADSHDEVDGRDDESSVLFTSDGESSTDVESSTDADSVEGSNQGALHEFGKDDEQDEGWDKIDSEEIQDVDADGESDAWAKALFIWAEGETVVAHFEPIGDEINVMTKEPIDEAAASDSKDKRWRLARLSEIHGRRYMLRHQALELFFSDSHELLLNFPNGVKDRDRFHAKLRNSCKVPMLWSPKSLSPRIIFRRSKLTELWKKKKLSNFEYLMALNRMAGRSFNDLTQYPVFPWVLADYTSATIDLTDSRVYRDLSKPVGALNPDRLARLLERYNELALFGFTEAEKFLYGSHYSSPGIVLHYLIRQEPFTSMAIDLQSGRFDCPDRLFFDIAESWNSCLTSTSDMKELIPEFFSLPEMFLNTNRFPLGRTQAGRLVDNVGLPPWAKGSVYEFIRIHRLALESDYVSQNLHNWIDLVFGYKQRGPEAEKAHNIFHHLSYEGSVDLDKIADEVDRNAAETHIQNFGQTPSQLIVEDPHPVRYGSEECWKPLILNSSTAKNLRCHTPSKQFANKRSELAKGAVVKLHVLSENLIAVYADMSVGTYRWLPNAKVNRLRMDKLRPLARRELSTSRSAMKRGSAVSQEEMEQSSLTVGNWSIGVTLGGLVKEELRRNAVFSSGRLITASELSLSTAEASALIISCGYWDETLKAHSADASRVLASETGGHHGAIRCLALGRDGALMVTGGQDGTARVWVVDHPDMSAALSDAYVQTALGGSNDGEQLLSCCHVLWGHDSPICCVDLDSNIDAVVSGSTSGLVCIHTLRRGEFIRSFRPPALSNNDLGSSVARLSMGTEGNIAVHMKDQGLHTFTINAVRLSSVDAGESLNDMKICSNDEILVTGGDRCQVLVRRLFDLQVCSMLDLSRHGPIRCIEFTPTDLNPVAQFLFIGSDDGMITFVDEYPLSSQSNVSATAF